MKHINSFYNEIREQLSSLILPFLIICMVLFLSNTVLIPNSNNKEPQPKKQVILKKILQITNNNDEFYFKYPSIICVDGEDNIYVLDGQRLLKFSKTGLYSGNLIQKGVGPGEVSDISNICIIDNQLVIHNKRPSKIIQEDLSGKLLKEFRIENSYMMHLIHYDHGNYYFFKTQDDFSGIKINEGILEIDQYLLSINEQGKILPPLCTFPLTIFFARGGGSWGSIGIGNIQYALGEDRYLFVSHSTKYSIKCYDLFEKKVIHEFGIKYTPQEIPGKLSGQFKGGTLVLEGKIIKSPPRKYFNDIQQLLIYKKHLWVVTSTIDPAKGVRVDRYDLKGKFIDSFYLFLPETENKYDFKWFIFGRYLYSPEINEDGNISIFKYEIDSSEGKN